MSALDLIPPAAEPRANLEQANGEKARKQVEDTVRKIKEANTQGQPSLELPELLPEVADLFRQKGYQVSNAQFGPNEYGTFIRW